MLLLIRAGVKRGLAVVACLTPAVLAQPQLTTIHDVLYKADGTRFNGSLTITWKTFESADSSNISMQSLVEKVVDGNVRVQLVPNASIGSVNLYSVRYTSEGKFVFDESWAVPSSDLPLRIRDVRVSDPARVTPGQILQADVLRLPADLAARPVKGPGYVPSRAAVINTTGALEAAAGNPSDCVKVDGTSGPCGAPGPGFVDSETPAGFVDGANATFTLANPPTPASSFSVHRNGILQKTGIDFTLTGNTIQFLAGAVPQTGDILLSSYRVAAAKVAAVATVSIERPNHGYHFPFPPGNSCVYSRSPGPTQARAFQFVLPFPLIAGRLRFDLSRGMDSAAGLTFALYDSAKNIIAQTAVYTSPARGRQSVTFANVQTLDAGVYYLAWASDSTRVRLCTTPQSSSSVLKELNASTVRFGYTQAGAVTGSGAALKLPAALGELIPNSTAAGYPPTVMLER